jgi:hypothetical protein
MSKLPTTPEELSKWLPKEIQKRQPHLTRLQRTIMVTTIMKMVKTDYEVKTFIEGWEAARTGNVDPERAERSLESMRKNGLI